MATDKRKNTVVYPRTNHDETFSSLGVHKLGDLEDVYRHSRKKEEKSNESEEYDINNKDLKVYDEELIREFVDIIFKKEISAINGILQETKYSFLPDKIQDIANLVDQNICYELKEDLQMQKDFDSKKQDIMRDIEICKNEIEEKHNYIREKEIEINQWETIRKEKEIKRDDFSIPHEERNDDTNKCHFQYDDTAVSFIKKQKEEQIMKDDNYFKAAEKETMDEEENRIILSTSANGNENESLKILGTKDIDQLVTLPSEQYHLTVSNLHENAIQMKEQVDKTIETISQAAKNQSSLYHTFKRVQFTSYGKGIVGPMEALQKEVSSENKEN